MSVRLPGSTVLVTGASGGIGGAIARRLHRAGASLLLSGRRRERLSSLAGELGSEAGVLVADLAEAGEVRELIERAAAVDVLVANAALPASGRLESFAPEEIDRALAVNLRAPVQLACALVPGMVKRGTGHVVFVSSLSGKVATAGGSIYSATKFGLRGFAFSLREELLGSGVGVTTVFPGFIAEAGMFADAGVRLPRGVGVRSPEHVAEAVVGGIEEDRAEVDVAPLALRLSGRLWGLAPSALSGLGRRLGSGPIAEALAEGQRDKR